MAKTKWPKYVKEANGRIVYRPYIPAAKRDRIETDKFGYIKPIRLGKTGDPEKKILRSYLAAKEIVEATGDPDKGTLYWLKRKYLESRGFSLLVATSRIDYRNRLNKLLDFHIVINNTPATVGQLMASELTRPLLRRLLDKVLKDYNDRGYSGLSSVNGQFRCLAAIINYGLSYYDDLGLDSNPCVGLKLFKENKRDRYVTDDDYDFQLNYAREHGITDWLPVFFEFAYLLAGRSVEITDLTRAAITDEGIVVKRRKGSKTTTILWSDRLGAAYRMAMDLARKRKMKSIYLLTNRTGSKLRTHGIQAAMRRLRKKMIEDGHDSIV